MEFLKSISFGWGLWVVSASTLSIGIIWQLSGSIPVTMIVLGAFGCLTSLIYGLSVVRND